MDEHLQKLVRELRKESCPPEVLDRVARRTTGKAGSVRRLWYPFGWAVAGLILLIALTTWQRQVSRHAQTKAAELAAKTQADRARVVQEAGAALGYVGQILLEAAAHSEDAILREAMPPLRNGLETTKNKIINRI